MTKYFTIIETATLLGVDRSTVCRMTIRGELNKKYLSARFTMIADDELLAAAKKKTAGGGFVPIWKRKRVKIAKNAGK